MPRSSMLGDFSILEKLSSLIVKGSSHILNEDISSVVNRLIWFSWPSYKTFLFSKKIFRDTRFDFEEVIKRAVTTKLVGIPKEPFQQCIEG